MYRIYTVFAIDVRGVVRKWEGATVKRTFALKPRPHQQQSLCRKGEISTLLSKTATMSKQHSTLSKESFDKEHCRMLQVERFFRQSRMLLRHCCRQQCWNFALSTKQWRIYGFWCPGQDFQTVPPDWRTVGRQFPVNFAHVSLVLPPLVPWALHCDKVETCSTCFDFVERTKFHERLVGHCCKTATMSKQRSTLSKESFDL